MQRLSTSFPIRQSDKGKAVTGSSGEFREFRVSGIGYAIPKRDDTDSRVTPAPATTCCSKTRPVKLVSLIRAISSEVFQLVLRKNSARR